MIEFLVSTTNVKVYPLPKSVKGRKIKYNSGISGDCP